MKPENYVSINDAAEMLGVTRQWVYKLALKYGYRTQVLFGKTVYLRRDIERTPCSVQRRSAAQMERWKKQKALPTESR